MPNCPYCDLQLAMCEEGGICQKCLRIFHPSVLVLMPGYDADEVKAQLELFMLLINVGVLKQGTNTVLVDEDGIIIHHLGELS